MGCPCRDRRECDVLHWTVSPYTAHAAKDLFDQYGVPYPEFGWTWDDFVEKAVTLRDPTAGVYGYASIGEGFASVGRNLSAAEGFDVIEFIDQHVRSSTTCTIQRT